MIRTAEFLGVEPASLLPRRVDGAPVAGGGGGAGAVPRTGFEPAAFCSEETLDGIVALQGRQLPLLPALPPLLALTATPATASAAGVDATRHQMSRAEAAWVREHAWTSAMRKEHTITPAASSTCPCQRGPCGQCSAGHHDQCPYTDPDQATWAARRADVAATGTTAVEPLNCLDHGNPMLAVTTSDGNPALLVVKDETAYIAPLSDTDITPPDDDTIAYCAGICTADDLAAKTGGTITHDTSISDGDTLTLITADGTPRTVKLKKNPAYTALTPSN